ncbi:MAG TPA: hypothetical protein VF472_21965 [Burkholderiaceae bacterium]
MATPAVISTEDMQSLSPGELFYYDANNFKCLGMVIEVSDGDKFFVKLMENGKAVDKMEVCDLQRTPVISFGRNFAVKLSEHLSDWHVESDLPNPGYPNIAIAKNSAQYFVSKDEHGRRVWVELATGKFSTAWPEPAYSTISNCEIVFRPTEDQEVLLLTLS